MKKVEKYGLILILTLLVVIISIVLVLVYLERSNSVHAKNTDAGCAYDNPPCESDYDCVNNICVSKPTGCQYNNPPCSGDFDCVDNSCIALEKSGCQYSNPSCSTNQECINNTCQQSKGCQYNNPWCPLYEECINNICREVIVGHITHHTYDIEDGAYRYIDSEINVSCFDCEESDTEFLDRSIDLDHKSIEHLNALLDVDLKIPLLLTVYLRDVNSVWKQTTCEASADGVCLNFGNGIGDVIGFRGFMMGGENRVTKLSNLRMSIHESMHQYTWQFIKFGGGMSGDQHDTVWFDEAMSISAALQLQNSSSDNNLMLGESLRVSPEEYANLKAGNVSEDKFNKNFYFANNAHGAGSIYLIVLEQDYDCDSRCALRIWKRLSRLSEDLPSGSYISNQDIKQASEIETGRDLTPLFDLLRIPS